MGILRTKKRSRVGFQVVEYVKVNTRRGIQIRERAVPPTAQNYLGSLSPSKKTTTQSADDIPGGDLSPMDFDNYTTEKPRVLRKVGRSVMTGTITDAWFFGQGQNDFLQEWVDYREMYLVALLSLEGGPSTPDCNKCHRWPSAIRCLDCMGRSPVCRDCCLELHRRMPFHRIQAWNGEYWEAGDLDKLGLVIAMGHGGELCPCGGNKTQDKTNIFPRNRQSLYEGSDNPFIQVQESNSESTSVNPGNTRVVIVASTRIWTRTVVWCNCPTAEERNIQLFRMHMFPASFKQPSTAFTFDVLDHYHIDAMECKTPASSFHRKLKRFTNDAFPGQVPVSGYSNTSMKIIYKASYILESLR